MSFTWTLIHRGWAECTVTDDQATARVIASCITAAPEDLLAAVARLIAGELETRAEFDAEGTDYRWIFQRDGRSVQIRLLELALDTDHDEAATEIWATRQTIDSLARAVIRGFDEVASTNGETGYQDQWRRPFPRFELEALRAVWKR
jgi:hypothetical protein